MERNRYKTQFCLIGIIIFLVVTSCASQGERKMKSIQAKYPQWDHATVEKLAALQIEQGMTKEMVKAALGKPGEETVNEGETVWEYNGYRFSAASGVVVTHRYLVYFRGGKVTRTTGDPNKIGYR
jgi:hypothetical protein